jgi:hypothetical protein
VRADQAGRVTKQKLLLLLLAPCCALSRVVRMPLLLFCVSSLPAGLQHKPATLSTWPQQLHAARRSCTQEAQQQQHQRRHAAQPQSTSPASWSSCGSRTQQPGSRTSAATWLQARNTQRPGCRRRRNLQTCSSSMLLPAQALLRCAGIDSLCVLCVWVCTHARIACVQAHPSNRRHSHSQGQGSDIQHAQSNRLTAAQKPSPAPLSWLPCHVCP